MSVYKVAQDVEADDKLLGPFSFRQFIYLIVVAMGGILAYGLWQLLPPLAIIPLPVMIFFGALALPLRKDQPMETYLAAIVSFYLKPKKRLWEPDGVDSLIEITAPKTVDQPATKNIAEDEAERRLAYLAELADTHGWSIRHTTMPTQSGAIASDVIAEAQSTVDVFDDHGGISQSIDTMIDRADQARRDEMMARMHQSGPLYDDPYSALSPQSQSTASATQPHYSPYPTNMHQSIIHPLSDQTQPSTPTPSTAIPTPPAEPPQTASDNPISPDIISLATNSDLSIETIAHEAKRIKEREDTLGEDEVVISLR